MRILFLHDCTQDYLADSLFHGLRQISNATCVDVPRLDYMYSPLSCELRQKLRGLGCTLYGLLPELPGIAPSRYLWHQELDSYDLVVIANVWARWDIIWRLKGKIDPEKLVILDGSDFKHLFPRAGWLRSRPWGYFTPLGSSKYFKRELFSSPGAFWKAWVGRSVHVHPIAFSIPAEKIRRATLSDKSKPYATHVVDPEVAALLDNSYHSEIGSDRYVFNNERDYFDDLFISKFGITTKRAGWDCLRHYELAANGCIPCFRDLQSKPALCAPHGLDDSNCISYQSAAGLAKRIGSVSDLEYTALLDETYSWAVDNSTEARARRFLEVCLS